MDLKDTGYHMTQEKPRSPEIDLKLYNRICEKHWQTCDFCTITSGGPRNHQKQKAFISKAVSWLPGNRRGPWFQTVHHFRPSTVGSTLRSRQDQRRRDIAKKEATEKEASHGKWGKLELVFFAVRKSKEEREESRLKDWSPRLKGKKIFESCLLQLRSRSLRRVFAPSGCSAARLRRWRNTIACWMSRRSRGLRSWQLAWNEPWLRSPVC